jgi:hypothetical protein
MTKVKTTFNTLTIAEKIQKGYSIVSAMDGNPNFPPSVPIVQQVTAALESLEKAHQDALYGGKIKKAMMYLAEQHLDNLMLSLAGYVQSESRGDAAIILSSGFELKGSNSASPALTVPSAPVVRPGGREGEVQVSWNRSRVAKSYSVRISKDNGATWEDVGTYTRSRIVLAGLESRSTPWFKVCAFGIQGHTDWSDAGQGKVA